MATIRKRGKYWHAQVRRKGYEQVTRSFDTRSEAAAWARDIEGAMDRRTYTDLRAAEDVTMADLFQRYRDDVSPSHKGASAEISRLDVWIERHPLNQTVLAAVTSADVAAWRDARLREVSPATVVRELGLFRRVIQVARTEWAYGLPANPVDAIATPRQPPGRDRRLRDGEEAAILVACQQARVKWLRPLVVVALETAMRRGELLGLTWSDIDFTAQVATLHHTKNGLGRSVPLSTAAIDAIRSLPWAKAPGDDPRVFRATADAVHCSWNRLRVRAGCPDLRFHDLRHEATTRLFEKGLNIMEVASITGHQDLRMLRRYTHLAAADLVDRLG